MAEVDDNALQILLAHPLVGPRCGQCLCGYGDASLPVERLGKPHALHVVEMLREAGLLKGDE